MSRQIYNTASVLVLNEKDELLILRRSEWRNTDPDNFHPEKSHQLDLPGGVIGDDIPREDERAGAVRELEEETGISAMPEQLKLFFAMTDFDPDLPRLRVRLGYVLKLDNMPEVKLSWEHEDFCWRPLTEVARDGFGVSVKTNIVRFLNDHYSLVQEKLSE
jgi:8-oxo-dGTP pyrophosphatase MutT (NUDIX family)